MPYNARPLFLEDGATMQFHKEFDVLVAGGGVAGVAAALAAARRGLRTALVEKTIKPGGLATSGLILTYTPLCDGMGQQVTFGLAEELLHSSLKYGPGDIPETWREPEPKWGGRRYSVRFSPASLVLALDELLAEAGVDLWLDTLVCLPVIEGDRISGLEVENKSGRGSLSARCIVDATGDADVAFRAGAPCIEQDNWLSLWALEASLDAARQAAEQGSAAPLRRSVRVGAGNTGQGHPDGMRKFRGTDGREVTEFVLEGRRLLREHYAEQQAELGEDGRQDLYPLHLPSMAQFRTTRRVEGRFTLADGMDGRDFNDAVGLIANWWRPGEVWQVPYGALVPREVRGLLAAGRCISAQGEAWEVTRVIHGAAHTGEIAGLAASLAVEKDTTPDALDVADVRGALDALGIPCGYEARDQTTGGGSAEPPDQH
ncbi:MAG: FAD-dependent oxidoreductase [Candidatus Brocadiia bacterium]